MKRLNTQLNKVPKVVKPREKKNYKTFGTSVITAQCPFSSWDYKTIPAQTAPTTRLAFPVEDLDPVDKG